MDARWLGWAGVEIEHEGATLLIDPLADPAATFAAFGEGAAGVELPEIVPPAPGASGALLTHLHRDHADAGALEAALADGARAYHPPQGEAGNLALAQAEHELAAAGIDRQTPALWEPVPIGPFTVTAVPAVDGLGDPQVSWVVEAAGARALHLGDTLFHGAWWQIARRTGPFDVVFAPINGAVVDFPHQQPPSPLPAAMGPEQAAIAAELLGVATVVPIHYGGYAFDPHYVPVADAAARFEAAATRRPYRTAILSPGEALA